MNQWHLPHQNKNKEHESNVGVFRVAAGLTIHELCKQADIHVNTYICLNNGTHSPLGPNGISEPAKKLALVLNAEFSDLWPRYFCDIKRFESLTEEQIISMFHQGYKNEGRDPADLYIEKEKINSVLNALGNLSKREFTVFKHRILFNDSLDEIAIKFNCSRERIRQIEAKVIKHIKYRSKEIQDILCN